MSWIVKFCGWLTGSDSSKSANQPDATELATRKTSSPDSIKEEEDTSKKPKESGKTDGPPRIGGGSSKEDGAKQQQQPPHQQRQPPQPNEQTLNQQPQSPQPNQTTQKNQNTNPQHQQDQPDTASQAPTRQGTAAPERPRESPQKKPDSYSVKRAFPFMESYLDMWEVRTFLDEKLGVDCYNIKDDIAELQRKSGRVESDEE
ncbi:hypothetical protein CPLU01_14381 [Colletotrichum plurivorum]|uniref:Uncharacterized protein n=1 Tax=Colletotrichum plurivorum TaxID=2175906 RepID=A0A8H6MZZ7_9PEZI|nr:hypothetical protein CPLU01_14381 [Colletotrichum plurivorum]